ncbi:YceD family protein [Ornithinibacillus californiensis]|uniref:YceD family protein n=1 Tax=Ornithinibacillus californiensis TaxID=161536 RepID=UPI00064E0063|nr:YceD family protein [Ornithinibacillus californiensis]
MKFTLAQLKKDAFNKPFHFSGKVDVSELETMNNDIRKINPVDVQGLCTMQGEQFFFKFKITGEMTLPCARTLVDVPYSFHIEAEEIFSSSPYYGGDDDAEIHPIHGEVLDLMPYIKENILLEVPFRVFSDEADSMNVIQKGNDWEVLSEKPKEMKIDPRFQKLESLFKDIEKEK